MQRMGLQQAVVQQRRGRRVYVLPRHVVCEAKAHPQLGREGAQARIALTEA